MSPFLQSPGTFSLGMNVPIAWSSERFIMRQIGTYLSCAVCKAFAAATQGGHSPSEVNVPISRLLARNDEDSLC
jgi:hypothetical protein